MGQYRISAYFVWQIGLIISFEDKTIHLHLPFIAIHIALSRYAYGFMIFGKYFKQKQPHGN